VDVLRGIGQLDQIRRFLADNPRHLNSYDKSVRKMNEYKNIYYLLVARDHWMWIDRNDGISIVAFDPFVASLGQNVNLHFAMSELLRYEWLPIEGRDFRVQYDSSRLNGVSIESETFYAVTGY